MMVAFALLWLAAVVVLAGRGMRAWWFAAIVAFPPVIGAMFALEPSFRGESGRIYLKTAIVVAVAVWVIGALASTAAWYLARRPR